MRLIMLLLALAVAALLIYRQLSQPVTPQAPVVVEGLPQTPAIPQRPQDLPRFEQELNQFVDEAAAKRMRELE